MSTETFSDDRAQGIDVSHANGPIDWKKVMSAGYSFAYLKATEGGKFIDPMFERHSETLSQLGMTFGCYHFFRPSIDPDVQARHFMATVKGREGHLPPVLDVELAGSDPATLGDLLERWLCQVSSALHCEPMVYCSPAFWDEHVQFDYPWFRLWIAEYGVTEPRLPKGFSSWAIWQRSETGRVPGVLGDVDLDVAAWSHQDMIDRIGKRVGDA